MRSPTPLSGNAGITVQSNHGGFDSSVAFQLAAAFFADAMESRG